LGALILRNGRKVSNVKEGAGRNPNTLGKKNFELKGIGWGLNGGGGKTKIPKAKKK